MAFLSGSLLLRNTHEGNWLCAQMELMMPEAGPCSVEEERESCLPWLTGSHAGEQEHSQPVPSTQLHKGNVHWNSTNQEAELITSKLPKLSAYLCPHRIQ